MGLETFVDWFAGVGGFRLGLESLGLKCVGACENDGFCRQIYEKNFGHEPEYWDAKTVLGEGVPDHDLFCAGFPCQAFSTAGKWQGFRGTEGTLFFDACRIIEAKRPHYLLLENVKSILRVGYIDEEGSPVPGTDGWVFYTILESLDELGYDCQWQVLNSRDFGVPQSRERVYIVGNLREIPRPEVFPLRSEAVGMEINARGRAIRPLGRFHPERKTGRQSGRVWATEEGIAPTLTSSTEIVCLGSFYGGSYAGRVYSPEGIAPTLITSPIHFYKHQGRLRKLTPTECERLQGFPDGWTERVSDTQRYKQAGNAVTVPVVRAIGQILIEEANK